MGNWIEEREVQRATLRSMLAAKMGGTTKLDAYQQRMSRALAEAELTKAFDDPYVHFGDLVQLLNVETGWTVAGDVSDKDPRPEQESCSATAAPEVRSPCSRNTFVVVR